MLRGFNIGILGLRGMLGLLLLNLRAVILIVVDSLSIVRHFVGWSQFCGYLTVEGGKFGFLGIYACTEHNRTRTSPLLIASITAFLDRSVLHS